MAMDQLSLLSVGGGERAAAIMPGECPDRVVRDWMVRDSVVRGMGGSGQVSAAADLRTRTLVVWCPDWPAVAAARQAGKPASDPVAVFSANRVQACNAAARAEGIHVGQRRRDAQSRCPELLITQVDLDRDARLFEPVAAAVESIAPGVEILRSGVVACPARGPRRYFKTEIAAAEKIVDVVEALDVECSVGVADVLAVAVLAAHRGTIVPPGRSAEFCAPLPITELARDPAISPPERAGAGRSADPVGHHHGRGLRRHAGGEGGDQVWRRRRAGASVGARRGRTGGVPSADSPGIDHRTGL